MTLKFLTIGSLYPVSVAFVVKKARWITKVSLLARLAVRYNFFFARKKLASVSFEHLKKPSHC